MAWQIVGQMLLRGAAGAGAGAAAGRAAGSGASLLSMLSNIGSVASGVADMFPKLEDEVTVEVMGQPGSNKRELYRLAMATAYGIVRPGSNGTASLLGPPPSMILCEYDAADAWVRFTVRYRIGVLDFALTPTTGPASILAGITAGRGLPVVLGPPDEVIGARMRLPIPNVGALVGAITSSITGIAIDPLTILAPMRFVNKVILTSSGVCESPDPATTGMVINSPNPRPPGDTNSRGAVQNPNIAEINANYLVPLVFAALSDPGSQSNLTVPAPSLVSPGFAP